MKVDLQAFVDTIFRVLLRPPPINEAIARTVKSSTTTIKRTLTAHTKALKVLIIGQSTKLIVHTIRVVEPLNRVTAIIENINKNVVNL